MTLIARARKPSGTDDFPSLAEHNGPGACRYVDVKTNNDLGQACVKHLVSVSTPPVTHVLFLAHATLG